jgi:hypothetical protein
MEEGAGGGGDQGHDGVVITCRQCLHVITTPCRQWVGVRVSCIRRRAHSNDIQKACHPGWWLAGLCLTFVCCAVLCCAVLCCALLCFALLCCAVLCCAVLSCAVYA